MNAAEKTGSPPVWLVGVAVAVVVVLVGWYLWGQLGHNSTAGIPDRQVKPGMYDFRKAAQEGTLGRRQE